MTASDAAYEEVCNERDKLLTENEKLKTRHEKFVKLLKDGDVFIRDLDIPPSESGYVRSILRELHAWIIEGN
jgi:hypothetical protein